jgi:hypothetical protein
MRSGENERKWAGVSLCYPCSTTPRRAGDGVWCVVCRRAASVGVLGEDAAVLRNKPSQLSQGFSPTAHDACRRASSPSLLTRLLVLEFAPRHTARSYNTKLPSQNARTIRKVWILMIVSSQPHSNPRKLKESGLHDGTAGYHESLCAAQY